MPALRNVDPRRASVHSMEHNASDGSTSKSPDRAASPAHDHHVKAEEPLPSSPLPSLTPSSSCSPPSLARRPSSVRAGRRRGDPHRVTRPRNAFIIFRSSYIKSYRSKNCKEEDEEEDSPDQQDDTHRHPPNQNEISKIAAKVWNIMSDEEKKPFCSEAYAEREEHRRLHPNFVYAANGSGAVRRRGRGKGKGKGTKSPTPIASPEAAFVPLSEIPPLELPPPVTSDSKQDETYPIFAPDVPIFFPHIDRLPDLNYELYRYPHGALPGPTLGDIHHNSFPPELPPAYSAFTSHMDGPHRYATCPLSSSASSDLPNDNLGSAVVDHSLTDDPTDSFFDFSAFAASADFRGP